MNDKRPAPILIEFPTGRVLSVADVAAMINERNWSGCQRRVYLILSVGMLTIGWCPPIDVRRMRSSRRWLCGRLSRLRG